MAKSAGPLVTWITLITVAQSISSAVSIKVGFDARNEFYRTPDRTQTEERQISSGRSGRVKRSDNNFIRNPLHEAQDIPFNISPRTIWDGCRRTPGDINTAGIYKFRVRVIPENSVRGHHGPKQNALYCDEQGNYFPAYWLPWWQGARGPVSTLPHIDFDYESGLNFLFTGLLSGCSIVVVAHPSNRNKIRIFHDSKPDDPPNKWEGAGLTVLAQASWCHYGIDGSADGLYAVTFMYFSVLSTKWYLVTQCLTPVGGPKAISISVPNNNLQYVYTVRRCPDANSRNLRVIEVPHPGQIRARARARTMPGSGSRSRSRSRSRTRSRSMSEIESS